MRAAVLCTGMFLAVLTGSVYSSEKGGEWTEVVRFIEWDLEKDPLQVKTDSEAGSEDVISVMFYLAEEMDIYNYESIGYFTITFDDPLPELFVSDCDAEFEEESSAVLSERDKTWTFSKSRTDLTIQCNGEKVANINFGIDKECWAMWSQDVAKIWFWAGGDSDDDTATDGYKKPDDQEWTDVEKFIEWDLEEDSLQVKTDSEAGSAEIMTIMFYTAEHEDRSDFASIGYVSVKFSDVLEYHVHHCTNDDYDYEEFQNAPPHEPNKIWTISKSSTDLSIDCNGVRVLDLNFASAVGSKCSDKWSQDVAKMWFWMEDDSEQDTASDAYRKLQKIEGEGGDEGDDCEKTRTCYSDAKSLVAFLVPVSLLTQLF